LRILARFGLAVYAPRVPRARRSPLLLVLAAALAPGASCRRGEPPRSLLLIVVDTVRRDHLAAYGYERDTAPTLGRLAAEGAVLDGVSPASWTQPATATLLTGLHPVRHQSIRSEPMPPEADTLAERLKRCGYSTLGVSANGLVSADWGFDQGFDELISLPLRAAGRQLPDAAHVNAATALRLPALKPPFFLYVHYVDPHAPYSPSVSWSGGPLGEHLARRGPVEMSDLDPAKYLHRDEPLLRDALDLYDGEIRQADDGVKGLLQELGRNGLLDRTVTIVASDHGEEFQDHGRASHGQTLYEEVLRVPLIVHAPGLVPPGTRHGTASLLDVVPTVLSLLGVSRVGDADLDGVDLSSFLRSGRRYDDPERLFLAHLDTADSTALAATAGRSKLVLMRPYRKQLFDLGSSRGEKDNRIDEPEGRKQAAVLAARLAEAYNGLAARALPRSRTVLTAEKGEALAALGYVGAAQPEARSIGHSIRPADPGEDGLLGWEDLASLGPCVATGDPQAAFQLLEGWYRIEKDGRWTWPRASVLLASRSGKRHTLTLRGTNHERSPVRFTAFLGARKLLDHTAAPGPFTAEASFESPESGPRVVRVERPEAFVPARVGLSDDRVLGVFLTSICLSP
jgi:arylsulfatase A-like enzyme